ncbi:winged helix-turn-helix domain-containing protein [Brachybacterium paraconglomeratum]|uniref:winged helix-turn-helix domain-containing protein n=1 Tax=Brachybacterium TaxID=43668 RepID=UPI0021E01CE4|nr:winged helix-turn-helix domain-containing protein [Brachybacterium atlanticum]
MTIALDRPTTSTTAPHTRSAAPRLQRVGGTASRPVAAEDAVTITVSVSLPAGTGDVEAALIADELRTRAQRLVSARGGRTTVSVDSPRPFAATGRGSAARTLPPRAQGAAAVSPLRPRRKGIVSPNSPARRDAEAARRRQLQATAVSPASPSLAPEESLVIDLFGRRVRIDGQDVDFTHKEFELLAKLARDSRRTISRTELMESVWADAPEDTGERTVDVHVRRVRTKLGRYRRLISTVRGAGYRLDPGSDVAVLGS